MYRERERERERERTERESEREREIGKAQKIMSAQPPPTPGQHSEEEVPQEAGDPEESD